jgi:hypothetical protein
MNLPKQLQESFLGQIFRVGLVSNHAQAQGEDSPAVRPKYAFKSCAVALLSQTNRICLAEVVGFRMCRCVRGNAFLIHDLSPFLDD